MRVVAPCSGYCTGLLEAQLPAPLVQKFMDHILVDARLIAIAGT